MQVLAWDWYTLLRHPLFVALVQLVVGGLSAYWLTEQWQRWRQQREFQHRTLVKFSELSYEMADRLAELLVGRGKIPVDAYVPKRREMVARWTVFVSTRGEVMASFGRHFVHGSDYQGLFKALNALRGFVNEPEPVSQERFEPEQEKFLAYREALVARMVQRNGLAILAGR